MPIPFLLNSKDKSFHFEKDGYTATLSRREILQQLAKHLKTEKGQLAKLKKYQSLKNEDNKTTQTYPLTIKLRNKAGITQETCFDVGFTQSFVASEEDYYSFNKILGQGFEGTVKTTTATPKTSVSKPHLKNKKIIKIATKKYTSDADLNIPKEIEHTKLVDSGCEYLGYRIQIKGKEKYIKHYYTQTHAEGVPLAKLQSIISSNGSLTEILEIMKSITDELEAIHEENVVHCDLHSENILINYKNEFIATIIDFGLAVKDGTPQLNGHVQLRSLEEKIYDTDNKKLITQKRTKAGEIAPLGILFLEFLLSADKINDLCDEQIFFYEGHENSTKIINDKNLSKILTIECFLGENPNQNSVKAFKETFDKFYQLFQGMLQEKPENRSTIKEVKIQIESIQASYEKYLQKKLPTHEKSIAGLYQAFINNTETVLNQIEYPTKHSFVNIYIANLKENIANLKKLEQQTLKKIGKMYNSLYGLHSLLEKYLPGDASKASSSLLIKHKEIIDALGSSYVPKLYDDQEAASKIQTCHDEKQLVAIYNHYISAFIAKEKAKPNFSDFLLEINIKERQEKFFKLSKENSQSIQNHSLRENSLKKIESAKKNKQHFLNHNLLENLLKKIEKELEIYCSTSKENTAEENLEPLVDIPFTQLKQVERQIKNKLNQPSFISNKDVSEVFNEIEKYARQLYEAQQFLKVRHSKTTWYNVIVQLLSAIRKFFNFYTNETADAIPSVEKSSKIINQAASQLVILKEIATTTAPAALIHRLFFSTNLKNMRKLLITLETTVSADLTPIALQALFPANKSAHLYSEFANNLRKLSESTLTPQQKALKAKLLAAITIGLDKFKTDATLIVDSNLINEKLSTELASHFTNLKINVDKLSGPQKKELQIILNQINQLLVHSEEGTAVYLKMTNYLKQIKDLLNQARPPLANVVKFFRSEERVKLNNIQNCLKNIEDIESYINQDDKHALSFSNGGAP